MASETVDEKAATEGDVVAYDASNKQQSIEGTPPAVEEEIVLAKNNGRGDMEVRSKGAEQQPTTGNCYWYKYICCFVGCFKLDDFDLVVKRGI